MDFADPSPLLYGALVALGIGLLVGAERERRKDDSPQRSAAGIRTFAVVALLGALGMALGGAWLLGAASLVVGAGALLSYWLHPSDDPGLTTEFALVLTCFLGGLAMRQTELAAGIGATLTVLLLVKKRLHHFVRRVLSEQEMHDLLLFVAMAWVVLPLAPDRYLGPFTALNPRTLAGLIVSVMGISAAGYVAVRSLGPSQGLPLAGLASGFISSTATIHAMGRHARSHPRLRTPAVAGAVWSSVATVIQMGVVVGVVEPRLLRGLAWPLGLACAAALAYGGSVWISGRSTVRSDPPCGEWPELAVGRAVDMKAALTFAGLLAGVTLTSAALNMWLGSRGLEVAALVSGLADAHAAAASAAALMAAGKINGTEAVWPVALGLSANTVTKAVVALQSGGAPYARVIVPGLVVVLGAFWAGLWVSF